MTHMMNNGQPCGMPDGHPGRHRSPESCRIKQDWRKHHPEAAPGRSYAIDTVALANRHVSWIWRAKCKNRDPDLFFPEDYRFPRFACSADGTITRMSDSWRQNIREHRIERAKDTCAICPVRNACLQDAIDIGEQFGIRGGLTAKERRELTRKAS